MKKFLTILIFLISFKAIHAFAYISEIKTNINGDSYYEEAKFKKEEITKPFYFIRHGQTDVNKYGTVPENGDVPLNEEGIAQAKRAAELLRNKNIKIIISSPLIRAKQTAEIINKELNVTIIYHNGLKEANRGKLLKENTDLKKIWAKGAKIPGAESLYELQMRVHHSIKELINKYDNALIVSHGVYFCNLTLLLNEECIYTKNAVPYHFSSLTANTNKKLYKITPLTTQSQ